MKGTGLVMKYFVLKPSGGTVYAHASRAAMRAYADVIREADPKLAADLERWVSKEERPRGS